MPSPMTTEDKVVNHREDFVEFRARIEQQFKGLEGTVKAQGRNLDQKIVDQGKTLEGSISKVDTRCAGIESDVAAIRQNVDVLLARRNGGNGNGGKFMHALQSPTGKVVSYGGGGAGIGAIVLWILQQISSGSVPTP